MTILINGNTPLALGFTLGQFPGGEPHVQWNHEQERNRLDRCALDIFVQGHNPIEFLQVAALAEAWDIKKLTIPYFPGGRQDRRDQTPLTTKMYADIVNLFGAQTVEIWDPHSDVTPALIENVRVRHMAEFVSRIPDLDSVEGFIAPDAGAEKKVSYCARVLNKKFAQAGKHRDPATGKLSGFNCPEVAKGRWIVLDDILDGGFTFKGLAQKCREANGDNVNLDLYVTHGIFSKGTESILEDYEKVYTTHSFDQTDRSEIQVIDFS